MRPAPTVTVDNRTDVIFQGATARVRTVAMVNGPDYIAVEVSGPLSLDHAHALGVQLQRAVEELRHAVNVNGKAPDADRRRVEHHAV